MNRARIAIFAVFFGRLPTYFNLWLYSCSRNQNIDWILITDQFVPNSVNVVNLHVIRMTLEDLNRFFSDALGIVTNIVNPYKICDFRPAFSYFLKLLPSRYEFWGHCDIDMYFGRLSEFISANILARYDKIFSVGHLTLYRNCCAANEMFMRGHGAQSWRKILHVSEHLGFDEHIGVNEIWRLHNGRTYIDETIILDVDPHIARFESVLRKLNYRSQIFYINDDGVFQAFRHGSEICIREFMYIHFQKRQLTLNLTDHYHGLMYFDQNALCIAHGEQISSLIVTKNLLTARDLIVEKGYRIRRFVRQCCNISL